MSRREPARFEIPTRAPPPLDVSAHALFLDLDGTLIEIAESPDRVSASADLLKQLHVLHERMHGALALITGRTIAEADRILAGAMATVAGVHGYEMRTNGAAIAREGIDVSTVEAAHNDAHARIASGALPAMLENKLSSIALHYRHAPDAEPVVRAAAEEIARGHGLRLLEGKMVFELAAGARTKADAVATLMQNEPFSSRKPVALGDDVTDENAFREARGLGGHAVLVGEPRPSLAQYHLPNPTAVLRWLSTPAKPERGA
ncbi:MAG: trehalose-phosphatase [Hyphomonadaceae bacterium]